MSCQLVEYNLQSVHRNEIKVSASNIPHTHTFFPHFCLFVFLLLLYLPVTADYCEPMQHEYWDKGTRWISDFLSLHVASNTWWISYTRWRHQCKCMRVYFFLFRVSFFFAHECKYKILLVQEPWSRASGFIGNKQQSLLQTINSIRETSVTLIQDDDDHHHRHHHHSNILQLTFCLFFRWMMMCCIFVSHLQLIDALKRHQVTIVKWFTACVCIFNVPSIDAVSGESSASRILNFTRDRNRETPRLLSLLSSYPLGRWFASRGVEWTFCSDE